jgi:hypothetical protein
MYHHGGPYDATLRSRNLDPRTSPVAAVQESNMEALRATPREYVMDSLRHHVPLQGTSTIPSGEYDYRGSRMSYEEGADLMREPDAPGGPYKRYADTVTSSSPSTSSTSVRGHFRRCLLNCRNIIRTISKEKESRPTRLSGR